MQTVTDLFDFLSDLVPVSSFRSLESRIFSWGRQNRVAAVALQLGPVVSILFLQFDLNLGRQNLPSWLKNIFKYFSKWLNIAHFE